MRLEIIFDGSPVPAARPRVVFGHAYTPKKYEKYKAALTRYIKANAGTFERIHPEKGSKARSIYLAQNRYALSVQVYQAANRGDLDNFIKTAMDALTQANVIADDSQIDILQGYKTVNKNDPKMIILLEKIEEDA